MSKSRAYLEKKLDELTEELKKVNTSFPSNERLDGWIPRDVIEEEKVVLAAKYEFGEGKEIVDFLGFEPVGVWKEVYDPMVLRKKIMDEIEEVSAKLYGPTVCVLNDEEN